MLTCFQNSYPIEPLGATIANDAQNIINVYTSGNSVQGQFFSDGNFNILSTYFLHLLTYFSTNAIAVTGGNQC